MSFLKKWYIYQKERFPLPIYCIYIFCIVFAIFCYSNYMGNLEINYYKLIPMFLVGILQFIIIRIMDEFKDYDEDCKYRPYRPVPRGIVSLKELKVLFIISMSLQAIITLFFNFSGFIWLWLLWLFFFIMSKGFFTKKFWDKHLLLEVFFDEIIIIFLGIYLASFIYLEKSMWIIFMILYAVSWVVEIARKIRSKEEEEEGVRTYTAVYGIPKAIFILFILETFILILITQIIFENKIIFLIIYFLINIINLLFLINKTKKLAKLTELSANIYIIIIYLSFGLLII